MSIRTCRKRCVDIVYKMEELTSCLLFQLQLDMRAGENGSALQTQLAGRAHSLAAQSELAASLG